LKIIFTEYLIPDYKNFKAKMLNWANRFNIFCFLDNNEYHFDKPSFDCILAVGSNRSIELKPGNTFNKLQQFYDEKPGWLFGHLGYDLKSEVENIPSKNNALINFGLSFFFEPELVIKVSNGKLVLCSGTKSLSALVAEINEQPAELSNEIKKTIAIQSSITKKEYLTAVEKLKEHILRGDCYEINFCQQFFSEEAVISPLFVYQKLANFSPNPFSALYKLNDKYCICASPERYLQKHGNVIMSQPIKGTSKRNLKNKDEDEINKAYLIKSNKEKSENVMVVDLVRNDLSKICKEGSVKVQELFGVYSFPQVHQMISTITGIVKDNLAWTEMIKASFPMGSMTGAPKKSVMQLIDEYEVAGRGLFSGSIGYITPDADFDFNVVIRSIFYDETKKLLSFLAGGGITFYSNAEDEYKESILKAEAIMNVLK
jgi:para-aminobenzoate synthetase component 1